MATDPFKLPENYLLAPEAAIKFFQQKGLQVTWDWRDMLREQHNGAFTVAKMMDMDLLTDVRNYMETAISEGWSINRFRDGIMPELERRGWWGRKTEIDPTTGEEVEVQLGSAYRLNTIYRTNMQSSYAAGRWQQIEAHKDALPYLMYSAILDDRVRDDHAVHNNVMLTVDDPFWDTHSPPNGFNCRCSTIQLSPAMADELYGKTQPDPTPTVPSKTTVDPRTGQLHVMPEDIDEGWDYNVGKHYFNRLPETLAAKTTTLAAIDSDMSEAVETGVQEPDPIPDLDGFEELGANDLTSGEHITQARDLVNNLDTINDDLIDLYDRRTRIQQAMLAGELDREQGEAMLDEINAEIASLEAWKDGTKQGLVDIRDQVQIAARVLWNELHTGISKSRARQFAETKEYMGLSDEQQRYVLPAVTNFVQLTNGKLPDTITAYLRNPFQPRASAQTTPNGFVNMGAPLPDDATNKLDWYRLVVYHETGHHVELAVLGALEAAQEFLQRRKTQPNPRKLQDIWPAKGFNSNEVAYEDKWISPYVGKIYSDGATEVISIGIEHFRSEQMMVRLAEKDPEHFNLIVGILRAYRNIE